MSYVNYTAQIQFIHNKYNSRQRNWAASTENVKALSQTFDISIDFSTFQHFDTINKDNLERFIKATDSQAIALKNIKLWEKHCGKLPILDILQKKSWVKMDCNLFAYISFGKKELFDLIYADFTDDAQKLWNALIWASEMSSSQVEKVIGKDPISQVETAKTYNSKEEKKVCRYDLSFMSNTNQTYYSYQKVIWKFELPQVIRLMQRKISKAPADYEFHTIRLPENIKIWESEKPAFDDISRVLAYTAQGNLKSYPTNTANRSSVGKMRKALNLREYYADNKDIDDTRHYLLANWVLGLTLKNVNVNTPPLDLIKDVFSKYSSNKIEPFEWTGSLLKGIRMAKSSYSGYVTIVNEKLLSILKQIPEKEWISTDNLEKYLMYREIDLSPMSKISATQKLKYKSLSENWNKEMVETEDYVDDNEYYDMVVKTHLYGSIFMFSALGLMDIAYHQPNTEILGKTYFSEWDGLYAFKLTNLGAYLLGKTKEYIAPEVKENTTLVFDENALIILGEAGDKLTDTLLNNYVQKAGTNRYIVTASSFLSDCKNLTDIKNKTALFKRTIGKTKLPQNWESFFESLLTKSRNVNAITEYEVFSLQAQDKELIRLIAQEKAFQNVVLKAEGYLVLVPKKQASSFKSKLKEYGYLV